MIYDDWGKPLTDLPLNQNYAGIDNINNYAGYTYDEVLELYFVQNRFYNAETRQFTQEDPIKDDSNWYAYCEGNPLVRVDWYGLETVVLRDWFNDTNIYAHKTYGNKYSGRISWDEKTKTATVTMKYDGRTNATVRFTAGRNATIDKNGKLRVKYKDLEPFIKVIDPPVNQVSSVETAAVIVVVTKAPQALEAIGGGISGAGSMMAGMSGSAGVLTVEGITAGEAAVLSAGAATAGIVYSYGGNFGCGNSSTSQDGQNGNTDKKTKQTSPNQMQKQVENGQAPKGVTRVDSADTNIPNSKAHIHFGDDKAALNVDGTWHDAHKGLPKLTKPIKNWIIENGWKLPEA